MKLALLNSCAFCLRAGLNIQIISYRYRIDFEKPSLINGVTVNHKIALITSKCVLCYVSMTSLCDLDLDPVTFIYELDLDILVMRRHTKNEVSRLWLSKVIVRTGQTDATERFTTPHSLVIK